MTELFEALEIDLSEIVNIHKEAFRGFFLTSLGEQFLKEYYKTILNYKGGLLLVLKKDNKIVGFASGFVNPPIFYSTLKNKKILFGKHLIRRLFENPSLLLHVVKSFIEVLRKSNETKEHKKKIDQEEIFELSSIAIKPNHGSNGLGKLLLISLIEMVRKRGAKKIVLTTDAYNNDRVNLFYTNAGFSLVRSFESKGYRLMNEYELTL